MVNGERRKYKIVRLELYINGSFFYAVDVKPAYSISKLVLFHRVGVMEEIIDQEVLQMKALFYKQLNKAWSYEIYCIQESRGNKKKNLKI